jgi:hypothetical protein
MLDHVMIGSGGKLYDIDFERLPCGRVRVLYVEEMPDG